MASLWEIFDVTSLKYDTTLGHTEADSGGGPPAGLLSPGWIRTGGEAKTAPDPIPPANCGAWTDDQLSSFGTIVGLTPLWGGGFATANEGLERIEPQIVPWVKGSTLCSTSVRVWCVQDR
jgi:hypothetical protein